MTTTITSIGSNQNINSQTPSTCTSSGTDEWVVVFASTPSASVAIGDLYVAEDEATTYNIYYYLVTAISGTSYTLKYVKCDDNSMMGCSSTSPCDVYGWDFGPAQGTFKRAFSTITSFEEMVDDASPLYWGTTDDVVGECHADDTVNGFDENDIVFTSKQSLTSVKLTAHSGSRHGGIAGAGVFIKPTTRGTHSSSTTGGVIRVQIDNMTIEWLAINMASIPNASGGTYSQNNGIKVVGNTVTGVIIRNNLIHDCEGDKGVSGPVGIVGGVDGGLGNTWSILNNIIYNFIEGSGDSAGGIIARKFRGTFNIYNNTIYKITADGGSKDATGIKCGYYTNTVPNIKNNIVAGLTASDQKHGFAIESNVTSKSVGTNLSDDTADAAETAQTMGRNYNSTVNPGALVGKTLTEISFVSTDPDVGFDLHIDEDSDCVDAGADLGTTGGVQTDINGRDRDASADTWDIGAHEFVPEATAGAAFLLFLD